MTMQANIPAAPAAPAPAAPVAPGTEGGEPSFEELQALLPTPEAPELEAFTTEVAKTEPVVDVEVTEATEEQAPEEIKAAPDADAALERATKAAARAREGSRRYAQTQRLLAERSAQVQRAAREAEYLRQENAAARAREATLKADPYKALKELGMTDQDLAARAMRENTPEAAMLRLQEQVEVERAARLSLEQRLVNERRATQQAQAEAAFTTVADNEEAYPRLSQLNASVQLTVAQAALAQIQRNGYDVGHLTDAQVAEACEAYLKPKRAAKMAVEPPAPTLGKPVTKISGKTLTNTMAQTRTVAPAHWDSLTEDQQIAHIAAGLPEPQ